MFGRIIRKISSFTRTATFRRFSQIEDNDNKHKENPVNIDSNLKEFSVSINTFKDLVQPGNIFIDKTLLIEKLLKTYDKTFLFTRPQRWGKTLNIDMLENFFQSDVNEATGMPDFEKQSQKYLFEKLNISKIKLFKNPITGKLIDQSDQSDQSAIQFQGQFPVIKLTIEDPSPRSCEDVIHGFEKILRPAFEKHSYILNSNKRFLIDRECTLIEEYVYNKSKKITWWDIGQSLRYLINALHEVYDRKVVLLIDEYDRNLNTLFADNSPFYSDTLKLFNFLLGPIKDNEKLLFTVITGVTNMAKSGYFTSVNHFCHDSVSNSYFSECLGFTESEVDWLLDKLIDLNPKLQRKEVKDLVTMWYNGYKIGHDTIYNPWSIMNCFNSLHKCKPSPYGQYWTEVGSIKLIEDAILAVPTISMFEELITNKQIEFGDLEIFEFEEIKIDERALFSLLLQSGYITTFKENFYKVPNYEVYSYYFTKFIPLWLKKKFPELNIDLIKNSFENTEEYGEAFQQEFLDRLVKLNRREKYFQTLVTFPFDILSHDDDNHKIYTEQMGIENKRIDILFAPKKGASNSVFILELKKAYTFENINKKIEEALLKVFKKKYASFALQLAEKTEYEHWENFHIRALVFSPDEVKEKLVITIKELQFDKLALQSVLKEFELIENEEQNKKNEDEEQNKIIENEMNKKLIELILSRSKSIDEYPKKKSNN